jgi:hypothetical protein
MSVFNKEVLSLHPILRTYKPFAKVHKYRNNIFIDQIFLKKK